MLVTVVDGIEYKFLDSHCFCTLYESNFSFPIYLNIKNGQRRTKILDTLLSLIIFSVMDKIALIISEDLEMDMYTRISQQLSGFTGTIYWTVTPFSIFLFQFLHWTRINKKTQLIAEKKRKRKKEASPYDNVTTL